MTTTAGSINQAVVITDAGLEANGGSYVISQQTAVPITRHATAERALIQGNVMAVYVVTQAQVDSGEFTVEQRAAVPVFVVTDKPARGRTAVPVFIVEDR